MRSLIFLTLLCVGFSNQSQLQYVEFFSDSNCMTSNGSINDTTTTLTENPAFRNASSVKINGMWRIITPEGDTGHATLTLSVSNETCRAQDTNYHYSVAQRFGDPLQNNTKISFFTETNFNGIKLTIEENNTNMTLSRPIMMLSWYFSGVNLWTIYSDVNFKGNETCVKEYENVSNSGYGFTWSFDSKVLVGSVRQGCTDDNSSASLSSVSTISVIILCILFAMFSKQL